MNASEAERVRAPRAHSGTLLLALLVLLAASQAHSQDASAPTPRTVPQTQMQKGMLSLDVVVSDSSGKPAPNLQPIDFVLSENGHPNPVVSFQPSDLRSMPCEIILLLDTIAMPADLEYSERGQMAKFLRQTSAPPSCSISIFQLTRTGLWQFAQPSTNFVELADDVAHNQGLIFRPALSPSFINAYLNPIPPTEAALKAIAFIAAAERKKPGRKLLFWIGMEPKGNEKSLDRQQLFYNIVWFSTAFRDSRIALYSIYAAYTVNPPFPYRKYLQGAPSIKSANFMDLSVPVLAIQSGGLALDPGNLAQQLESCIADAASFYTLSFNPLPAVQPDEYHELSIRLRKAGLSARANTGYYDQPYYTDQPDHVTRQVTVAQLQQFLNETKSESDSDIARRLSGLLLTERLSSINLSSWLDGIHGKKTRQALIALADSSVFLNPPPDEIVSAPPPDIEAQNSLIIHSVEYLNRMIPRLPDFFATRTTVLYAESPPEYKEAGKPGTGYEPMHPLNTSIAEVHVRGGKEILDQTVEKWKNSIPFHNSLTIQGTFGPILLTVMGDALASQNLSWSRWQQEGGHRYAVFHFSTQSVQSHYQISSCCLPEGDGTTAFQMQTAYHGELVIDPTTSTIVRLSLMEDLRPGLPLAQAGTMVEYGPVQIGGKTYICPIRSVSIARAQVIRTMQTWDAAFRTIGPYETNLDDVVFSGYHIFRSSSRILPGFTQTP